jgi:uncharacterized protein (TIGR04551 family)
VWGEYLTPIGLLRFGRMPSHWGLGMLANGGDGIDSDYQSTSDRLMLVTGIKKYDLYFAAAWDFANEGPSSASLNERQGQPYDLGEEDDVNQYVFVAVRRKNPDLTKDTLARGGFVLNGGAYVVYRNQLLANDESGQGNAAYLGQSSSNITEGYLRRGAEAAIPDLWLQFLYEKFRFEAEAAMIYGSLENTNRTGGPGTDYVNPPTPTIRAGKSGSSASRPRPNTRPWTTSCAWASASATPRATTTSTPSLPRAKASSPSARRIARSPRSASTPTTGWISSCSATS